MFEPLFLASGQIDVMALTACRNEVTSISVPAKVTHSKTLPFPFQASPLPSSPPPLSTSSGVSAAMKVGVGLVGVLGGLSKMAHSSS